MRARPLHRYKMYGYELLGTQQMDLHLLRYSNKLLVKPLPEYILSTTFWEGHLCMNEALWESATGWLLSYVWLITSPWTSSLLMITHCCLQPSLGAGGRHLPQTFLNTSI